MHRLHAPRRRPRARRGASIVELVVALLLLNMALLTLASVSAVAVRRVGDAGRRTRAARAGSARIEALIATPCGAPSSGAKTLEHGVAERWTGSVIPGGREIVDSIQIDGARPERIVLRARIAC